MNSLRIVLVALVVMGIAIAIVSVFTILQENSSIENIEFGCTPEFWRENLDLWKVLDVDYDDDFDDTFGWDYFEPDITLKEAINLEGPGMNHLARSGVAAYLDSIVNPYADVEILREMVRDNNIHGLDKFISLCNENT